MKRLAAAALLVLCLVGAPRSGGAPTVISPSAPCGVTTTAPAYTAFVVVVMENHSYSQTAGHMPYLDGVRKVCGTATTMRAVARPSLPNYIALVSGSTAKDGGTFTSDCAPAVSCQTSRPSVFGQVSGWTYAQGMTSNCKLTNTGRYAVKHNPHAYFIKERTACQSHDAPLGTPTSGPFKSAISGGKLARYNLVVPDLCNDMHDCGVSTGDAFLKTWLPLVLAGPQYQAGRLAVVVTWDEPSTSAPLSTPIESIVIAPSVPKGRVVTTGLTHYSLLRAVEQELGVPLLGAASSAPDMRLSFNL